MTDVSNLDDLAGKISGQSPNIKKYALAQAAATQSQEAEIRSQAVRLGKAEEEIVKLKGSGPQEPPPPPPPEGFHSPIGTISNLAPGFFPPTNIDQYGVVSSEGPPPAAFRGTALTYRTGITCQPAGYTNISESECLANGWQMHTPGGANLTNQGYGGVLADPANSAYQARWIEATLDYLAAHENHGPWVDDMTPKVMDFYDSYYTGWPAEHPSQAAYRAALVDFAQACATAMAANGYVNASYNNSLSLDDDGSQDLVWLDQIGPEIGGHTVEYWMEANGNVRVRGAAWYQNWDGWRAVHQKCRDLDIRFDPITYGGDIAGGGQSFVMGTYLLDWMPGGGSLFYCTPYAETTTDPWSSVYDAVVTLGLPAGVATQGSAGVWSRNFEGGSVEVNANTGVATYNV